ncbi:hypothetical protein D3C80_1871680 [compost metagenome]
MNADVRCIRFCRPLSEMALRSVPSSSPAPTMTTWLSFTEPAIFLKAATSRSGAFWDVSRPMNPKTNASGAMPKRARMVAAISGEGGATPLTITDIRSSGMCSDRAWERSSSDTQTRWSV